MYHKALTPGKGASIIPNASRPVEKRFYLIEMYCVSYFAGNLNFRPFYTRIADDMNPKANKMNRASCTMPGMSGEFKKGDHGGGTRKGEMLAKTDE